MSFANFSWQKLKKKAAGIPSKFLPSTIPHILLEFIEFSSVFRNLFFFFSGTPPEIPDVIFPRNYFQKFLMLSSRNSSIAITRSSITDASRNLSRDCFKNSFSEFFPEITPENFQEFFLGSSRNSSLDSFDKSFRGFLWKFLQVFF